jgi:hypothetical protein
MTPRRDLLRCRDADDPEQSARLAAEVLPLAIGSLGAFPAEVFTLATTATFGVAAAHVLGPSDKAFLSASTAVEQKTNALTFIRDARSGDLFCGGAPAKC